MGNKTYYYLSGDTAAGQLTCLQNTTESSHLQTLQSLSENLQGRSQHNHASEHQPGTLVGIPCLPFSCSQKGAPCIEDRSSFTIKISAVGSTGLEGTGYLIQSLQSEVTAKQVKDLPTISFSTPSQPLIPCKIQCQTQRLSTTLPPSVTGGKGK